MVIKKTTAKEEHDHFNNNLLLILLLILIFVTLIGTIAILNVLDNVQTGQTQVIKEIHKTNTGNSQVGITIVEDDSMGNDNMDDMGGGVS